MRLIRGTLCPYTHSTRRTSPSPQKSKTILRSTIQPTSIAGYLDDSVAERILNALGGQDPPPTGGAGRRPMKAHIVGGGFGGLAAAAYLIRNAGVPGQDITIYDAEERMGGGFFLGGSAERG